MQSNYIDYKLKSKSFKTKWANSLEKILIVGTKGFNKIWKIITHGLVNNKSIGYQIKQKIYCTKNNYCKFTIQFKNN